MGSSTLRGSGAVRDDRRETTSYIYSPSSGPLARGPRQSTLHAEPNAVPPGFKHQPNDVGHVYVARLIAMQIQPLSDHPLVTHDGVFAGT